MNSTFTIDEDIIRRLMLRQKSEEAPVRRRPSLLRFWHGAPPVEDVTVQVTSRPRWS